MKSLRGDELDLNDAPARAVDLFFIDGNNLAYRAFHALPPELATSRGEPTNAILGFANMLFKLVVDYHPRGVAVAWDRRPMARIEAHAEYKSQRKPMPDLLRAQFPSFVPLVEAFGYPNLSYEGWEADDVVATLADRTDRAGLRACVVSTDRDAFQLVTDRVCLMMTPRGVTDVLVYTPERVRARYGIGPESITDFIALKGDSADNIPPVPGIGEKTASELLQRFGSLEGVIAHAAELPPAKRRAITEHADAARASKALATMRRDLELDCDPAKLVLTAPDRSGLRAMCERFELKNLLGRLHLLDPTLAS